MDAGDSRQVPGTGGGEPVVKEVPDIGVGETGKGDGIDVIDASFGSMRLNPADETEDYRYVYNMNHSRRGLALIINNRVFEKRTGMGERTGTDVDAANLYGKFKSMQFEVQMFNNLTAAKMLRLLTEAAAADHTDADCFACAILSHGDQGVVYGIDAIINIETLTGPFKGDRCASLAGKPKLFFIQACRGSQLDHGAEVADASTDTEKVRRIPSEADFLMAFSTVPGYFSWRNQNRGSWFIQALCAVLSEYGSKKEIQWIMTRVNRMVAYDFESNAAKDFMNKKKQVPAIVSMLTKELYFSPKK